MNLLFVNWIHPYMGFLTILQCPSSVSAYYHYDIPYFHIIITKKWIKIKKTITNAYIVVLVLLYNSMLVWRHKIFNNVT